MKAVRKYGSAPFDTVVIHGGPGAPGEMEPVAGELSADRGVLEPLLVANSLEGQVEELCVTMRDNGDLPVTLIGHSWGAWLSVILASRHPEIVGKLLLVSSGPFEEAYGVVIERTRLGRLTEGENAEIERCARALNDPSVINKDSLFARVGELLFKADSYDPLSASAGALEHQYEVFQGVWPEASELRSSGKLLNLAGSVECPVVAVHGDYDPHPCAGVLEPLSDSVEDFKFVMLENCGHYPWLEREARDSFFEIVKRELPGAA